jgi:MYXO-CTERM domain-containing protein
MILRAVGWVAVAFFAALSAYGWSFFVAVGNAHGPGLEIAIIAGAIALGLATMLRRRHS